MHRTYVLSSAALAAFMALALIVFCFLADPYELYPSITAPRPSGQVDLFYEELSRILKRYLGGRFRIDLMESTTSEIHGLLSQTGIESDAARETENLLINCDQVKFAKSCPDAASCKQAVEQVYRIVDTTRPADAGGEASAQFQAAQ